ncbi:YciK family oxidoreductase [Saccharophagus degradans]|uniref:Short-chain dehydrogenase/reductase SDR n=1 Tax=Saccharophagus degradans (strain 2-40 / ATCC 43961 / DSM 17024) TaxID=203122 RepID=Q21IR7_SACD2|nr:YciK family oxidoreductase [Saccharophagus degradans]ABD81412.1 short-chain dehydrogenase/reductase SDR [Saccharophagus degradans 2-40]
MIDSEFLTQYKPRENSLADKIIVITGAGDGIGRCVAKTCAQHGATVVLLGRTQAKLESVYDEIEAAGYPKPAIYPMNLEGAIEQDFSAMADVLETEFGKIDGLIHNASELGPRTPIANYSAVQWQKIMQVNVNAPFMMTKALLPLLDKSTSASILFTSSSVGAKGRAYWGAYAASKAAIENLVETLADELDGTSKIRVNSLNPGATRTGMRAAAYPAEDPTTVTEPEAIMNRYLFLLGQESELINGQHFDAQPK